MKKIVFTIILSLGCFNAAFSQEVYKEILKLAKKEAADESKSIDSRKIATFKVDELNYMAMKTRELMPDSTMTVLDNQAYAMYEFVNLYIKKLSETAKKKEKSVIKEIFKTASIQNPRFRDMDRELVEGYFNNEAYLTQFSLDTDWIKATAQAREELRKREL